MTAEDIWNIWMTLESFISKKEQESAIEEFLNTLYDLEEINFNDLLMCAEDEEERTFVKVLKRFIKENELEEEEY